MNLIKFFFEIIGLILSYIYPLKLYKCYNSIIRHIYTGYFKRYFRSFGRKSVINPAFLMLEGPQYISIGKNCYIGSHVQLTAWDSYLSQTFTPQIIIGDNCSIGDDSHITAINRIILGKNILLGKKILITDNAHGASERNLLDIDPLKRPLCTKGEIKIDDNVWIGEKSSIIGGVHIGKGCIIAANSVVTKDVPPYCVIAGNPARIIKNLNQNTQ